MSAGCDLILGYNIMKQFKLTLDREKLTLEMKNPEVFMSFPLMKNTTYHATNSILLRPYTQVEIETVRYGPQVRSTENPILVDNYRESETKGIIPKLINNDANRSLNLTVINNSKDNILLPEGEPIAVANFVEQAEIKGKSSTLIAGDKKLTLRKNLKLEPLDMQQLKIGPVSTNQRKQLENLIREYHYIFSRGEFDIGRYCGKQRYRVSLTTNEHQVRRFIPVPENQKEMLQKHIDGLVKSGIVEPIPFTDEITTSFVIIRKRDGTYRVANDSRSINNVTIRNKNFVIPIMTDIIKSMSNNRYYSSLDMNSSFFQIPIDESQRQLYTFISPCGTQAYRYCTAPFGSSMISNVFQSIMASEVLRGTKAHVYIDDVTICSPTFKEHILELEAVFERFSKFNLSLKMKKCTFANPSAECFGFTIDINGYRPNQARIEKLKTLKPPATKRELRGSLASLSYYRNHIKGFSEKAADLYRVSGENAAYKLTDDIRQQWTELIDCLGETILMNKPKFKNLILTTDASQKAIAGVLSEIQDGKEVIIAVDSKVLSKTQEKWATQHKELNAIFIFLKKYEKYLITESFLLRVDNISVSYMLQNIPKYEITGSFPSSRYLLYISTYNFKCVHTGGTEAAFVLTDLLSRGIIKTETQLKLNTNTKKDIFTFYDLKSNIERSLSETFRQHSVNAILPIKSIDKNKIHDQVKLAQQSSIEILQKLRNLRKSKSKFMSKRKENVGHNIRDILYYKSKLVVPPHFVITLLEQIHYHESAFNLLKLIDNLELYWPKVVSDVREFINSCNFCQTAKSG